MTTRSRVGALVALFRLVSVGAVRHVLPWTGRLAIRVAGSPAGHLAEGQRLTGVDR